MFGMGNNAETGFNPEAAIGKLPENAAEYQGEFVTPQEGRTNLESAMQLMRIHHAVEQEQR